LSTSTVAGVVAVTMGVTVNVGNTVPMAVAVRQVNRVLHPGKGYASTWAGVAISQSISKANNSVAKQSTSAVPLETIFARFLFVFNLNSPTSRTPPVSHRQGTNQPDSSGVTLELSSGMSSLNP
jgi:hypothetical protein